MARYDMFDTMTGKGSPQTVTPEERMMNNERKRVAGLVRQYQRNPEQWKPAMVTKLSQLADRYDLPFAPNQASALKKFGTGAIGALDAMLLNLIPDDAYIDESTKGAASTGKALGTLGSFLIPGAAVAKGAQALSKLGLGGKVAGKALEWSGPGMAAQLKETATKLAAPMAKNMGVNAPWVTKGLKSIKTTSDAASKTAVNAAVKTKNPNEVLTALNASTLTGAKKSALIKSSAKKLFGNTDSSVAKAWIAQAGGGPAVGGLADKVIQFMNTSGSGITNLRHPQNITKLAKDMKVDRAKLAEVLKDYDTIGDFYKAYWKGLSSPGGAPAGVDYKSILQGIGPTMGLGYGLKTDIEE